MISVLIPVYNVESYLQRALDSLLDSTYTDLEILCINDGSTDNSLEILEQAQKKDPRIKIFSQENRGLAATRNVLIEKAQGDLLFFLDGDDYIDPKTLEMMKKEMDLTGADLVQSGFRMDYRFGSFYRNASGHKCFDKMEALHALAKGKYLNNYAWGKLMKKELLEGVEFPAGKLFEDSFTVFKIVENANVVATIPNRYYHYVQRRGSIANRMSLEKVYTIREAYEYEAHYLQSRYSQEHFHFDHHLYNCDMVIIYTLIVFSHRKEQPKYIPAELDWSYISLIRKIAWAVWLALAMIKLGPGIYVSKKKKRAARHAGLDIEDINDTNVNREVSEAGKRAFSASLSRPGELSEYSEYPDYTEYYGAGFDPQGQPGSVE